jgi:hypothetical protein
MIPHPPEGVVADAASLADDQVRSDQAGLKHRVFLTIMLEEAPPGGFDRRPGLPCCDAVFAYAQD